MSALTHADRTIPMFGLDDELRELREEVRTFATDTLRPRAAELEWRSDPAERVAWDLVEEASRRGWRTYGLAPEDGGAGGSALALSVLVEELSYGDMGFAVLIDQCLKAQRILASVARGSARRLFLDRFVGDPRCVLALCFTEPETASDYIIDGADYRFRTEAVRRADGCWVLNGYKRYISNGADAGLYCVFACTDPSQPAARGTSVFLVAKDDPGLEIVKVHEKMSQRGNNNAALRFTDLVLAPDRLLGEAHTGYAGSREILKESAITAGATTLGTAQAAYDLALDHARTRVQGGRPLIEHANIQCRFAEMYAELQAVRSLVWRAAWAVENDPDYDIQMSSAAKVFAAETCMRVALEAAEMFGALAIMYTDSPVNKCVRDCMSFLHSDGAQDSHRIRIGRSLIR
ncbi:MAG: acyl-CoA/acyl-ACP dehydrogenase [Streptosporangiales bacterium]|nr:acyl-CoA/acyl-ACP dehydrogenase [Streptosporangiales bacterium]